MGLFAYGGTAAIHRRAVYRSDRAAMHCGGSCIGLRSSSPSIAPVGRRVTAGKPPARRTSPQRSVLTQSGWKRGEHVPRCHRYADASGIVTHTLDLGGGILLRPRRFRPRASVLDCSSIRCDYGNCERVLQLDPRKPPPVPCRRMPRYVAVGSSPLDGETPVSEASRANPEFRRGTVLGDRSAATE